MAITPMQEQTILPAELTREIAPQAPKDFDVTQATSLNELTFLAKAMAGSGYFKDASDVRQALTKMLIGRTIGVSAVPAMMSIHVIEGKPSLGAQLLAALVKASKRYDYRVVKISAEECEISFTQNGENIGTSRFTMEDAKRAGLAAKNNWRFYPDSMLFARALSKGVRMFCPDVIGGVPVYTEDEIQDARDVESVEAPHVHTQPATVAAVAEDVKDKVRQKRQKAAEPTPEPAPAPEPPAVETPASEPPAAEEAYVPDEFADPLTEAEAWLKGLPDMNDERFSGWQKWCAEHGTTRAVFAEWMRAHDNKKHVECFMSKVDFLSSLKERAD